MGKYCFGIDVGGTTVKCGLFEENGSLIDKWEIPTRTENGGENVLPDIAATVMSKMTVKRGCHRSGRRHSGTGHAGRGPGSGKSALGREKRRI